MSTVNLIYIKYESWSKDFEIISNCCCCCCIFNALKAEINFFELKTVSYPDSLRNKDHAFKEQQKRLAPITQLTIVAAQSDKFVV
ncbi:hypothetical protein BpHYR1_036479 [Brachionus plicatilis]|uniref:Uncharacterized protein n=1 Tax=Brachionus plicatilis TaxID=10195 RepID=A0A3M7P149_BRAPC|nr:hypothetical protein BpHYR1_036479 [Brachionus plicatilis]